VDREFESTTFSNNILFPDINTHNNCHFSTGFGRAEQENDQIPVAGSNAAQK